MDALNVTTIICPDCGAESKPTAEVCRKCGGTAGILSAIAPKGLPNPLFDRPWVIVVLMLHVGLLGIPVYWKTSYSLGVRLCLVIASVVYTVGAVVFIVVMLKRLFHPFAGG